MLCIRFVHMCVTDSIVHKCVLVKEESLLPIVLCCVIKVHCILIFMRMLLGFDSYIYQMCSYLVQAIFAVFLQEQASSHCSLL